MTEYRVSSDVLAAKLAGETVLLDMTSRHYFQLNATAARVWDSLERDRTIEEIVADLCEAFDAPRDVVEAEAHELIASLVARNLVSERSE